VEYCLGKDLLKNNMLRKLFSERKLMFLIIELNIRSFTELDVNDLYENIYKFVSAAIMVW